MHRRERAGNLNRRAVSSGTVVLAAVHRGIVPAIGGGIVGRSATLLAVGVEPRTRQRVRGFFSCVFCHSRQASLRCCFNTAQRGAGLPQCPSVIRRFAKVNGFGTTRRQLIEWSAIHPLQDSTSPRLQIFCSADAKNSPLRPLARQIGPVDIKGELIWDRLCIDGLRSAKRNRPRAHLHASSGERFWDDPL